MLLRPNTKEFNRRTIVENEIVQSSETTDELVGHLDSLFDHIQGHLVKQHKYIGFLEGGYLGLAIGGVVYAAVQLRKR